MGGTVNARCDDSSIARFRQLPVQRGLPHRLCNLHAQLKTGFSDNFETGVRGFCIVPEVSTCFEDTQRAMGLVLNSLIHSRVRSRNTVPYRSLASTWVFSHHSFQLVTTIQSAAVATADSH
jgi:hypothetical protein